MAQLTRSKTRLGAPSGRPQKSVELSALRAYDFVMTQAERSKQFTERLKAVGTKVRHSVLAKQLKISRAIMRNWMYRDTPPEKQVRKLKPAVDQRWHSLFRKRKK